MAKYGMIMDVARCNGCYNCFLACRDEHCGNEHPGYSAAQPMLGHFWMKIIEKERGKYPKVKVNYLAIPCMHCDKPSCRDVARDGAIYKRNDGIVIIDPIKAVGQKDLLSSCPYQAIYWNEEKQLAQKCTLCAHLLDQGWPEPRCVEACPTKALVFGDVSDPQSEISQLMTSGNTLPLNAESGLDERVQYIGLPERFIAGSVVFGDTDECAYGAVVTIFHEGITRTMKTNNFGDFEFEGLPKDEEFIVTVEVDSYCRKSTTIKTINDIYLGDIILEKPKG